MPLGSALPHPGWETEQASLSCSLLHPLISVVPGGWAVMSKGGGLQDATQATASQICFFFPGPSDLLSSLPEPASSQAGHPQDRAKANLFHTQSLCLLPSVDSPLTWALTGQLDPEQPQPWPEAISWRQSELKTVSFSREEAGMSY